MYGSYTQKAIQKASIHKMPLKGFYSKELLYTEGPLQGFHTQESFKQASEHGRPSKEVSYTEDLLKGFYTQKTLEELERVF